MQKDVSGSILLGLGVVSSIISRTGSTEYNLGLHHQALLILLVTSGAVLLYLSIAEEYRN